MGYTPEDSTAKSAQGAGFYISDGQTPETFYNIANVKEITDLFSGEAADIETTHLKSEAKEFIVGLRDDGTSGATVYYDPYDRGQMICRHRKNSGVKAKFEVRLSNLEGTVYDFSGFVKTFPVTGLATDTAVESGMTIRITGAINVTPDDSAEF